MRPSSWRPSSPTEGAATFDKFNAKAMAAYYLDDAEIALVTRDDDTSKVQNYIGRERDREVLRRLVQEARNDQVKEHRRIRQAACPDILVIAGTFDTNTLKADSPKIPFYQTRVKEGDKWLMSSLRIYFLPKKP